MPLRLPLLLTLGVGLAASAAEPTRGPTLSGTLSTVSAAPGDQTDAHVSGDWVAYSSEVNGGSELHFRNLARDTEGAVPTGGGMDFLNDISGTTVVYTHLTPAASAIYAFNLATHGAPIELAPEPGSNRRSAAIGGRTVAWQQDDAFGTGLTEPEIVTYDLISGTSTRLTNDGLLDKNPQVSPDGNVVVWTKCQRGGAGCDIWRAVNQGGSWSSQAFTGKEGEDSLPDTNGELIVWSSARPAGGAVHKDIYWEAVAGGPEQRLALVGEEDNPAISRHLIAFEHRDPTAPVPNWDIWLYDLDSHAVFALTDSPVDETLNDLTVSDDGLVRVVFTAGEADYNVYALSFRLSSEPPGCDANRVRSSCAAPGARPELATLDLGSPGHPAVSRFLALPGEGMLCVDESASEPSRNARGAIKLNGREELDRALLGHPSTALQRSVSLSERNVLEAVLGEEEVRPWRARVLGVDPRCPITVTSAGYQGASLRLAGALQGERRLVRGAPVVLLDSDLHVAQATPEPPSAGRVQGCGAAPGEVSWLAGLVLLGLGLRRLL